MGKHPNNSKQATKRLSIILLKLNILKKFFYIVMSILNLNFDSLFMLNQDFFLAFHLP